MLMLPGWERGGFLLQEGKPGGLLFPSAPFPQSLLPALPPDSHPPLFLCTPEGGKPLPPSWPPVATVLAGRQAPRQTLLFSADLHRCAVFCLLQIGTEIYDTEMVLVDRTLTDICFESTVLL